MPQQGAINNAVTRRGKLGSIRIRHRLDPQGVCVASIRPLEPGYIVCGIQELGLIGAAPKNFIVFPKCATPNNRYARAYVAKKPVRKHTGFRECVTEYLIARLGRMLPLQVAEARLVRLGASEQSPPDVRFMSRYFLQPGESLLHGVEIVAQCFGMEKAAIEREFQNVKQEQSLYALDLVDDVIWEFGKTDAVSQRLREGFARMIAFDALIGANDRHAGNWGIVEDVEQKRPPRFSPVFDTARGLLLRYSDADLERVEKTRTTESFIKNHAERSLPLIGTPGREHSNHFELVRYMVGPGHKRFGQAAKSIVFAFRPEHARSVLHREFGRLFSPLRLRFIDALLRYRHQRLIDICSTRGST
jgi:hypothetical protein